MDIDEFLDKEIQAEKKEDIENVSSQTTEEESVTNKVEVKDTIEHYFQLWDKVSEAKFKWDDKLYDELDKEGNKVKERFDKSILTADRQKKAIKRLIGKALTELENKDYEAATKLYSEISDMRNKLPTFLLEERKDLNREIFLLYEKLHDKIDLKFINDFKESITKVQNLIKDSISRLNLGDIEKAKIFYEKALDTYKSLPNGFLSEKIGLGAGLLKLYKDLSIQTQIKDLQQHLSKEATRSYKHLTADDKLKHLSEMINERKLARGKTEKHGMDNKTLLPRLVARKMERAKISLKQGLYPDAKKNIEAILRVDPGNREAKQLLRTVPVEH